MSNLKRYILAALAAVLFAGPAHAGIASDSTDFGEVNVGTSSVTAVNSKGEKVHIKDRPGIAVKKLGINELIDFQTLQSYAPADSNGVSSLSFNAKYMPKTHKDMGVFRFAKVSGANVYFGEWSQTGSVNDGTHTTYYAGDTSGTTVPTTGSASYAVKGISNYGTNSVMNGTFYASFNGTGGTLRGSLTSSDPYSNFNIDIGTATIYGVEFSGNGAYANTDNGGGYYDLNVRGRFFGAGAKALAGKVKFPNFDREYDTAFGGAKN